jgi:hypothetical protein
MDGALAVRHALSAWQLVTTKPIAGALVDFLHVEANPKPSRVLAPVRRLSACALEQFQFRAEFYVRGAFPRQSGEVFTMF